MNEYIKNRTDREIIQDCIEYAFNQAHDSCINVIGWSDPNHKEEDTEEYWDACVERLKSLMYKPPVVLETQFTGADEELTVTACAIGLDEALGAWNDAYEACEGQEVAFWENEPWISIVVAGVEYQFILGGPQSAGLTNMLDTIAEENGYEKPSDMFKHAWFVEMYMEHFEEGLTPEQFDARMEADSEKVNYTVIKTFLQVLNERITIMNQGDEAEMYDHHFHLEFMGQHTVFQFDAVNFNAVEEMLNVVMDNYEDENGLPRRKKPSAIVVDTTDDHKIPEKLELPVDGTRIG